MNTNEQPTITITAREINLGHMVRDPFDGFDFVIYHYYATEEKVTVVGTTIVDERVCFMTREYEPEQFVSILY